MTPPELVHPKNEGFFKNRITMNHHQLLNFSDRRMVVLPCLKTVFIIEVLLANVRHVRHVPVPKPEIKSKWSTDGQPWDGQFTMENLCISTGLDYFVHSLNMIMKKQSHKLPIHR